MNKQFPKDLLAELCAEIPDYKTVISYHGKDCDRASLEAIARIIDVHISHYKEDAKKTGFFFSKNKKKEKPANKKEEVLKNLKNKVLNLSAI
jgi:hypothetical protein